MPGICPQTPAPVVLFNNPFKSPGYDPDCM